MTQGGRARLRAASRLNKLNDQAKGNRMLMSVATANDVKVLDFEGKLDTQTSPEAQDELTRLIGDGARKILVHEPRLLRWLERTG